MLFKLDRLDSNPPLRVTIFFNLVPLGRGPIYTQKRDCIAGAPSVNTMGANGDELENVERTDTTNEVPVDQGDQRTDSMKSNRPCSGQTPESEPAATAPPRRKSLGGGRRSSFQAIPKDKVLEKVVRGSSAPACHPSHSPLQGAVGM